MEWYICSMQGQVVIRGVEQCKGSDMVGMKNKKDNLNSRAHEKWK